MATPAAILSILVTANTGKARAELVGVQKQLGATERHSHKMAKAAGIAGLAIGVGLAEAAKTGFTELKQSALVSAQTTAGLKSTGKAAHVTSKEITDLATSIMRKTGIDDEAVQSSENMLLTFTNVRKEAGKGNNIFKQATVAVADMATKMNNGAVPSQEKLAKTSIMIGKALNDPIKGLTSLGRVGVQFTEAQKKQIEAMVKSGDTIGAQKLILRELRKEMGGAAAAAGKTLPGQLAILRESYNNLAGTVMKALLPALEKIVPKITTFVQQMQDGKGAGGEFVDGLRDVANVLKPIGQFFADHPKLAAYAVGGWVAYKTGALGALGSLRAGISSGNPWVLLATLTAAGVAASQQTFSGFSSKTHQMFDQLRKDTDPRGIDNFATHLQALGDKGGPFGADMRKAAAGLRSMNKPALEVQNAIDKLARGVPADMSTISTSVRLNMRLIKKEMGSKSAEAKEALSKNFMAGVDRIRDAMHAGLISTKEGLAKIAAYFRKDLALYGITGKQASRYLQGNDTLTGKPVSGPGGKAKGGWIGHPGQAGGDNVPIMVGRGEAVLNRHQQGPVNAALQATYGMSLGGLFSRVNRPHYMASGGFAGMVGKANQIDKQQFPYKWGGGHNSSFSGPYDCSGAVSAVLHAGGLLGAPRVSGDLMNYGKPGPGAVTIFANPTHTYMRLGGKYFGTSRANPGGGAGWFPGAPRAGFAVRHADASAATIKRVMFAGGLGALSGIGQAGLDGVRSGASSALAKVAFGGYTGGGDPPGNFARGGFVGAAGIAALASQAGFSKGSIPLAVAVALAESGGRSGASHRNADGSIDRGLWQINSIHGRQSTFNPLRNARAAFAISKHGRNWNPWTMYRNGRYKRFLGKARKVAGKVATGGMGQIGAATGGTGTLGGDIAGQFTGAGSYVPAAGTFQVPPPAADDTATTDSGEDPNQPLIDSNNALAAANQALADAERELRAEVKRWNDFSSSVAAVTSVQAIKALADTISGQIVGTGYRGRALTASSGSTIRY